MSKLTMIDISAHDLGEIRSIHNDLLKDLRDKWHELLENNNIHPFEVDTEIHYEFTDNGVKVNMTAVPRKFYTFEDE